MNKQFARSLFMDYLYDEIDEEHKKELEATLEKYPELREELEEMQETSTIIQNIPLEESPHKLLVVKPENGRLVRWWKDAKEILVPDTFTGRIAISLAAVFILTIMLASFAKIQVTNTEAGWSVAFGSEQPVIQQGVDENTLNEIIHLIREENLMLASTLVEESQQQQEVQMQEAVNSILEYMEAQRRNDLQMIGRGFAQLEEDAYYQYLQTNQALGDLLYTINYEN